jgi:hypothetical protein
MNKLLLLTLILLLGCGAEEAQLESTTPNLNPDDNINPNHVEYLKRQSVECSFGSCPESIAKIIVFDKDETKINQPETAHACTGVLVSKNLMLTSASCVRGEETNNLNITDCSSVYAIFPKYGNLDSKVVRCVNILSQSPSSQWNESKREAWKNDYVVFAVDDVEDRQTSPINFDGIDSEQEYTLWRMRAINSTSGTIESGDCRPLIGTLANPMSTSKFSSFIPMSGCGYSPIDITDLSSEEERKNGSLTSIQSRESRREGTFYSAENTGSAVFNDNGEVVAIVSSQVSNDVLISLNDNKELEDNIVNSMIHTTNLGCINFPGRSSEIDDDCKIKVDRIEVELNRTQLVKDPQLYAEAKEEVSNIVLNNNHYFVYDVEFVRNHEGNNYGRNWEEPKLRVKCFDNHGDWINDRNMRSPILWFLKVPRKKFKYTAIHANYKIMLKFDDDLKPYVIHKPDLSRPKEYNIEFSPKQLKKEGKSRVEILYPPKIRRQRQPDDFVVIDEMTDC